MESVTSKPSPGPKNKIELPGLPSMGINEYNQKRLPRCLTTFSGGTYIISKETCGQFNFYLTKHTGDPIILSPDDTLNPKDHYLELTLHEGNGLEGTMSSLKELVKFVKRYDAIKWLVGASWLGSVVDGNLIKRYGFYKTEIPLPCINRKSIEEYGLQKQNSTRAYQELLQKSKPVFIYAHRNDFLSHFSV